MQRLPIQLSVSALLIAVAGVALNVWLFRFGPLAGLLGLSLTKHLAIAWLCQTMGVDRRPEAAPPNGPVPAPFADGASRAKG
ncbi:hypothetical protein [Tautonia sociabilis]|uniref:Uncharacterized protein n=1 Tax=Tautonia sociabilis TaxID=2080755 RepID=A0A432MHC0_9BACT|nr:hypothetical protein [Tautonia sociabilis]RUL86492.1 hypothetical protein TsocGM_16110 [Tautonia sociabilis]